MFPIHGKRASFETDWSDGTVSRVLCIIDPDQNTVPHEPGTTLVWPIDTEGVPLLVDSSSLRLEE